MNDEEHKAYHRKLGYVVIILLIVLFGGATFYHYAEKWNYIDALYFSAATMTTVGYGDITPKTNAGKLFTVVYVFLGVAIALYGLSILASHFVEIREEFWLQKLGQIKIRRRAETFFGKLKSLFDYEPGKIVDEYEKSVRKEK